MLERRKHISTSFDSALDSLKNDALMMSSLAERLLERAMQGLLQRDTDLCNAAIADDEEIDVLEKQIDQEGVNLMIRYHPVASDIRQVISTMKMSSNLERIADQSVTIARRAKKLHLLPNLPEISLLEPLYQEAIGIVRDSLRAFVDGDTELAVKLKPRDRHLDFLNAAFQDKMAERMAGDPDNVQVYFNLIFIARALERVGDLATNIGEHAFWQEQAEDIRHTFGAPEER